MTRVASTVPAESDILCEGCGYTLNGLPADSRCPECGKPITESLGSSRVLPEWELLRHHSIAAFFATSRRALFSPTNFYRTLATRRQLKQAVWFARMYWLMSAIFFALAAALHVDWYNRVILSFGWYRDDWVTAVLFVILVIITYLSLAGVTGLAGRLTNWEASYRSYRMPLPVVLRGMYYHAVHYLPVAIFSCATVDTYRLLIQHNVLNAGVTATKYLYVLCAEVILAAFYLFETYWIGMRNMMYANR